MSKEWDKANMKMLGVNVKKEVAEKFAAKAAQENTTVAGLLRGFIEASIRDVSEQDLQRAEYRPGLPHIVSYKNTDRLKHEVAFHNPDNLSPDGMLNWILDEYFRFVRRIRA